MLRTTATVRVACYVHASACRGEQYQGYVHLASGLVMLFVARVTKSTREDLLEVLRNICPSAMCMSLPALVNSIMDMCICLGISHALRRKSTCKHEKETETFIFNSLHVPRVFAPHTTEVEVFLDKKVRETRQTAGANSRLGATIKREISRNPFIHKSTLLSSRTFERAPPASQSIVLESIGLSTSS